MKKTNLEKIIILLTLVFLGISYRLLDYPANFSPLAAISLFAGFYFTDKRYVLLPLSILFLTDISLGFYNIGIMLSVYFSFCLAVFIGRFISKHYSLKNTIAGSLAASIMFFLVTNYAVWQFGNWYAPGIDGLARCFTMAIPFFRNTMLGDLFFTGIIFGAYEVYRQFVARDLKIKLSKILIQK